MIPTLKKFLAFLPLAGILAACSSGVVDTWDPESEIKGQKANDIKCQEMKENPTHRKEGRPQSKYYLDGNVFYDVSSRCDLAFDYSSIIGKTYTRDGYKIKYIKQGNDIVEFSKNIQFGDTSKKTYKSIR